MKELSVFDPTVQPNVEELSYSKRLKSLSGLRIGLVENTKFNSDKLLMMIADILKRDYGVAEYRICSKRNASVPAHEEILSELTAHCDAVIAGIGD
jgi:hypothetical protein